jgi:hypothetical protein
MHMHLIYRHAHDVVYTEATVLARWQRFYFFSSPSIGYQKPLPQHGLSSCPYLGTRVGPVLWGTASN